jgi:hypothetical protein
MSEFPRIRHVYSNRHMLHKLNGRGLFGFGFNLLRTDRITTWKADTDSGREARKLLAVTLPVTEHPRIWKISRIM